MIEVSRAHLAERMPRTLLHSSDACADGCESAACACTRRNGARERSCQPLPHLFATYAALRVCLGRPVCLSACSWRTCGALRACEPPPPSSLCTQSRSACAVVSCACCCAPPQAPFSAASWTRCGRPRMSQGVLRT
jgi:hypothetical protein